MRTILHWFRNDLRLDDNPGLKAAASLGRVLPVFIWSPEEEGGWPPGAASRWWLHRSLASLCASLAERGLPLVIRRGPAAAALKALCKEAGADGAFWSRRWEPAAREQERKVADALASVGAETRSFESSLLFSPDAVKTPEGRPYRVFTPYWNRCGLLPPPPAPVGPLGKAQGPRSRPKSLPLDALCLNPKVAWDSGLAKAFVPGEAAAHGELKRFLKAVGGYSEARDFPDRGGTSRLSPRLHFGEVSVHRVWKEASVAAGHPARKGGFLGELGWRDFGHHILYHHPRTPEHPLDARFEGFPWRTDPAGLDAWKKGRTGFPLVDAGMRQLWTTGWMHNRVRMVVSSFLVKDLLLDWREGARWFWDTLVDADLAANTLGWQWSAGCGADAAPFFRIFNPGSQAERFDPQGGYVRRWAPGPSPAPVVDHALARARALDAFGARRAFAGRAG